MIACKSTSVCRLPFISAATSPARRPLPPSAPSLQGHPWPHAAFCDFQVRTIGDLPDLALGAIKNGQDQPGLPSLHRPGQRIGAARMHDAGQHRFEISTALDQPIEPMLGDVELLARRGASFQDRGRDDPTRRVCALAVQHQIP